MGSLFCHRHHEKMDMLFLRRFPEYTKSKVARYQFYMANWKAILNELIEKELILADAQEKRSLFLLLSKTRDGDVIWP